MIIFTDIKSAIMPLDKVVLAAIKKYNPTAVYFRDKSISDKEYFDMAKKLIDICKKHNVPFYICHRYEIAEQLGVKNFHTNLNFLSKIDTKHKFDNISVSIHSKQEIELAINFGATNLVYGHIFETICKKDLSPRGLDSLKEICSLSKIPVIAIGGINSKNAQMVLDMGASDFAVMSSAMTLTF